MDTAPSRAADRVGPFVAGSSSSDLLALAQHESLGLRAIGEDEQKRDPHQERYGGLKTVATEFFFDYDGSSSLVFQKTGDSEQIPDFVQLVSCRLVQDRLGGLIFFGVNSDAGSHEHVDQQESAWWEQAAEISAALASKYADCTGAVVNFFNFAEYPELPRVPGISADHVFSSYARLVTSEEKLETKTRIGTGYCGPTVLLASDRKPTTVLATPAAQTSQSIRRLFGNDQWFVIVNHAVERYVRTIESLHIFTTLIYLSRQVMDDVGRKLNSERGAQVAALARRTIESWEESLRRADESKRARIAKLSQVL
jgi:hypothetical protein